MLKFKNPSITFLICTRNRSEIVYQCVINLLACSRNDIEIIVRDNCSTDSTLERLSSINDDRFKIYTSPENQGTLNFFEITKKATGHIVTWLSDEDNFHFEHLDFILSKFEDPSCDILFGSIVVGKSARCVTFADEEIADPVRAHLTGLQFSGCGGLFIRRSSLSCINSFNISNPDEAYTLWNYYPIGFFASRCIKLTLLTTSRVVVTQARFANTTDNWSKLASGSNTRFPHYYPESVFDRLSSSIANVLFKNLPVSLKTQLIYRLIRTFHLQTGSYIDPAFIQLLSENYQIETVQRYVDHITRLKLDNPIGKFLWRWTRTSVLFYFIPKRIGQWRQLAAK